MVEMTVNRIFGGLSDLPFARRHRLLRESSWDRTGGNDDFRVIGTGEKLEVKLEGPGCIRHMWFTGYCRELYWLRKVMLRIYWDGEESPSVETPFGDFFGAGHGVPRHFVSLPLTVIGRGPTHAAFNCFFPMPFNKEARIVIANECESSGLILYYHFDYEVYDEELSDDILRFHAKWRREKTEAKQAEVNLTGEDNYLILYAEGFGHYAGAVVSVKSLAPGWWGEGDDMIFVDGEKWPPSIHGTGTEDYFLASYGFQLRYSAPFHGVIHAGDIYDWTGRWTVYRFHIEDPIPFRKSIKVTIEHGHANDRGDDWSSVAYWYQREPHIEFFKIPEAKYRIP